MRCHIDIYMSRRNKKNGVFSQFPENFIEIHLQSACDSFRRSTRIRCQMCRCCCYHEMRRVLEIFSVALNSHKARMEFDTSIPFSINNAVRCNSIYYVTHIYTSESIVRHSILSPLVEIHLIIQICFNCYYTAPHNIGHEHIIIICVICEIEKLLPLLMRNINSSRHSFKNPFMILFVDRTE